MTFVSYFLLAMAVVFGMAAVVLYFVLDIRRCWRIVRGRHYVCMGEDGTFAGHSNVQQTGGEATQKLAPEETQVLFPYEETLPPETITLVQDIVLMDADYVDCAR